MQDYRTSTSRLYLFAKIKRLNWLKMHFGFRACISLPKRCAIILISNEAHKTWLDPIDVDIETRWIVQRMIWVHEQTPFIPGARAQNSETGEPIGMWMLREDWGQYRRGPCPGPLYHSMQLLPRCSRDWRWSSGDGRRGWSWLHRSWSPFSTAAQGNGMEWIVKRVLLLEILKWGFVLSSQRSEV